MNEGLTESRDEWLARRGEEYRVMHAERRAAREAAAGLADTLEAAWQGAQAAWYAADNAWAAELLAMYGKEARDARYDAGRNAASPALARLNGTRIAARAAYEATRNTALVFEGVRDAAERGGR